MIEGNRVNGRAALTQAAWGGVCSVLLYEGPPLHNIPFTLHFYTDIT